MIAKYLVIAATLIAMSGVATAGAGEEVLALDLSAAGGSIYFLKCVTATGEPTKQITNCSRVSVWEQANVVPGLQSTIFASGNSAYDPDSKLLA